MDTQKTAENIPFHENVAFSENSTVLIWRNSQNMSYDSHWHTAMEVIIPVENYYDVSVGSDDYHLLPQEILVIPPGEIHSLRSPDSGLRYIYLIDISFLSKIKGFSSIRALLSQPVYINHESYGKMYRNILKEFLEIEAEYYANREYYEMTVYSILLKIFTDLGYNRTHNTELFSNVRVYKKKEYIQKLNIVMDFIDTNYTEELSLEAMASMVGFSKYHFSRLFTEYTGHTFCDYINHIRVKSAESLLSNSELSITEIAMQSGFSSIATFNRLFKSFTGCSPSEYRNLHSQTHLLPALVSHLPLTVP